MRHHAIRLLLLSVVFLAQTAVAGTTAFALLVNFQGVNEPIFLISLGCALFYSSFLMEGAFVRNVRGIHTLSHNYFQIANPMAKGRRRHMVPHIVNFPGAIGFFGFAGILLIIFLNPSKNP